MENKNKSLKEEWKKGYRAGIFIALLGCGFGIITYSVGKDIYDNMNTTDDSKACELVQVESNAAHKKYTLN